MDYDRKLIERIGAQLLTRKLTVAAAESVTSGHVQAALSLAPNASQFFQGGITAYNIGQKCRHLLVEPTHALESNCVSEKVSTDMALYVCRLFSSDYGISVTGYATTVPEQGIHELFAYAAIAFRDKLIVSEKIIAPLMDSLEVQIWFTNKVLENLEGLLK